MEPEVKVWEWKNGPMYFRWTHKPFIAEEEFERADPVEEEYFLTLERRHVPYIVTTTIKPRYVFAKMGEALGEKYVVISGNVAVREKVTYASVKIPYNMWNKAIKIARYYSDTIVVGIWRRFFEGYFKGPTYVTVTTNGTQTIIMVVSGEGGIHDGDMDR